MNEYLIDLYSAFSQVAQRYYFAEVFRDLDNYRHNQEAVIQTTENSFSAEMYRHLRNIMDLEENIKKYKDLSLDFDIRKDWFDENIINNNRQSFRPDLTLHQSQVNWDPDFQKIYVEVKTNSNPYVKDDIQKLANSLYRLHFERGVFVSVNSNYENLIQLLKPILISENRRLNRLNINIEWNRIYLFHSILNGNNKVISTPISFQQIINL
jgi:hypothetical protein